VLDSDFDRTGNAKKYTESAAKTINIDHHVSNEGCGDINVCRPDVGSVCEVLFDLLEKERIDCDIAKAIYIGIIHDTGVFQYSNTRPETLETAAYLIGFGFDFSKIIEETFYQKTYLQSQIMGRALMESVRFMDGRCIVGWVNRKIMDFYNVTSKDFEGIVNQLRNIKGIDCAIFMYQTGLNEYKVSMRSTENVDVAKVASYFGGGGHMRAAGCTMSGTLHDCVNNLSQHILEQLKDD
jgi:phosphoesterase RecJ-like protein